MVAIITKTGVNTFLSQKKHQFELQVLCFARFANHGCVGRWFNSLPHDPDFKRPWVKSPFKTLWEKEKKLAFSPFPAIFSTQSKTKS